MLFRVAVLSLLGYLAFAPSPDHPAASPPPPPAPMVVVVPTAASSTRVVDVRRADLEQVMREPRVARIVPTLRHAQMIGVKLYAIRPGSPLAAIGLENGDVLRSVNDIPIAETDSLMAMVRAHADPDHFDLEVERRGERVRILVLVHGPGD